MRLIKSRLFAQLFRTKVCCLETMFGTRGDIAVVIRPCVPKTQPLLNEIRFKSAEGGVLLLMGTTSL